MSKLFIKKIELINFMSHSYTVVKPAKGVNVLVGQKGSGKTGILEAIRLAFGGLGRERHRKLGDFIKHGENEAVIRLFLNNAVTIPNKGIKKIIESMPLNSEIILERAIKKDGTNVFKLNNSIINKNELLRILSKINISPDNNLFFLPQERVNEWVTLTSRERLDLFLSAIGLYGIKEKIDKSREALKNLEKERRKYGKLLDEWLERLQTEESKFKPREIARDKLLYYYVLKIAYLYKKKEELTEEKKKLENLKREIETQLVEHKSFLEEFDKKIEQINNELKNIREQLDYLIGKEKPSYEFQLKKFEEEINAYQAKLVELDERYSKELSQLNEIAEKWGTSEIEELQQLIEEKKQKITEIEEEILNNDFMIEIMSKEDQIETLKQERDKLKREVERNREYLKEVFRMLDPHGVIEELFNDISYSALTNEVIGPIAITISIHLPGRLMEEYIFAIENALGPRLLSSFVALTNNGLKRFLKIARKKRHGNKVSIYSLSGGFSDMLEEDSIEIAERIVKMGQKKRNQLKEKIERNHIDLKPLIPLWVCDVIEGRLESRAIIESYNWDVPVVVDVDSAMKVLSRLNLRKAVTLDGEVIEYRRDPLTGASIFRTNPSPVERRTSVLLKLAGFDITKYQEYEERLLDEIRMIELEIKRLNEEVKELKANLPERIKQLNQEKSELEAQIFEITQDMQRIQYIKSKLSEVPKERERIVEAIEVLKERIDSINDKIAQAENEIEELRKKELELVNLKESMVNEYSAKYASIKSMEREIELIPARINNIDSNIRTIINELSKTKEEIETLISLLIKIGQLPESVNKEEFIEQQVVAPAERLIEEYTVEEIEKNLMAEEQEHDRYKKIILEAREHFENIKALKRRVNELKRELERLDNEMNELKKFYEEELKSLFSELRRRLTLINKHYKRVLSFLGYSGWIGVKSLSETEFALEVTIDINRDRPVELDKGGFSSGEKTTAIMALIIAILSAYPSPIYVFDEFDVFLDDKSLSEVMALIREFLKGSQGFITTTHRDEIIEHADKVFFLKFDKDKKASVVIELPEKIMESVKNA